MDYDFVIMGSGFGGSVSALRLVRKGYKVLVIEQGRRFSESDFPKRNWNLRKWLWVPGLRFYGFFRIALFRHITVLAGTGVGGGSLVYANTLPVPRTDFFKSGSWKNLLDWEKELAPYYQTAKEMLGVAQNPKFGPGDEALMQLADSIGKKDQFFATDVAVFFGEPKETVVDPFFNGNGPAREGCRFCGGCMVGCRYNAKNILDKNYLYLAEKEGAEWSVHVLSVSSPSENREIWDMRSSSGERVAIKRSGFVPGHLFFPVGYWVRFPSCLN